MKALVPQTVTVPASAANQAGVLNIAATGKYFYCQAATTSFGLQFDGQLPTTCQTGFQIGGTFKRLTFTNPNTISIAITFYVADEPITYVSNNEVGVQSSYSVGHGSISLPASGGSQAFSGSNNGQRRKQIVVHNLAANLSIQIQDGSGNIFDELSASQEWTFESDAAFIIYNPNASAVSVTVGETFYT